MVFLVFFLFLLACGCSSEPPIKQPTVTVSDIELTDVSFRAMTVNTTVLIDNPNPFGANLNRIIFDVYYLDDTPRYLGHGERYEVDIHENGNTSLTIPVTISNMQAFNAIGALARKGSITLRVNGSAFIDVKVTEYELPFTEEREFAASEFEAYFPVSAIESINVTEKVGQVKDFLSGL
jgi:LEA14-like dessication related protein